MKITPTQYAESLYAATKDKKNPELDGVLENFVQILAKNNHWKLKNAIMKKFGEIYNRENRIIEAEIISREELSSELRNRLSDNLRGKYFAKEIVLKEKIDEKIKGGIIVRVGDEVMDASVGRQLNNLKKFLES